MWRVWTCFFATTAFAVSCHGLITTPKDYDTIIIGLGSAGTTAAGKLARAGKRVLALEAQDRVGGRVWTQNFGDGIVEVGAEWIHGTYPSLVYDAAVANNVSTKSQQIDNFIYKKSDGSEAEALVYDLLAAGMEITIDASSDKPEPLGDIIIRRLMEYIREMKPEALENKKLQQEVLRLLNLMAMSNEAAKDWNDCNANSPFKELDGDIATSWHRHGYKTYFDIVLNKYKNGPGLPSLELKLNSEVTQIQLPSDPNEKVIVKCKDGSVYTADTVIVTVSLGVLKDRHSTLFLPTLPQEKVKAIEAIGMGAIGKIIFSFDHQWWPNQTDNNSLYGFIWRQEDLEKLKPEDKWTSNVLAISFPMGSTNTMTLWLAGDRVWEVESLSDEEVRTKALSLLRRFINHDIPEPTAMIRTKWCVNPFTLGTYSYESMQAASVPGARDTLAEPLKDSTGRARILFSGEATHVTQHSTVHGAAASGDREAQRVLAQSNDLPK